MGGKEVSECVRLAGALDVDRTGRPAKWEEEFGVAGRKGGSRLGS